MYFTYWLVWEGKENSPKLKSLCSIFLFFFFSFLLGVAHVEDLESIADADLRYKYIYACIHIYIHTYIHAQIHIAHS